MRLRGVAEGLLVELAEGVAVGEAVPLTEAVLLAERVAEAVLLAVREGVGVMAFTKAHRLLLPATYSLPLLSNTGVLMDWPTGSTL
jgi:hypothetical protein